MATAKIRGRFDGEALLKNISITGCRLEHTVNIDVQIGSKYMMCIMPEKQADVGEFDLSVEARWVEAQSGVCMAGFSIVESPKGKLFQRYVDYLEYRAANP
ncbi:hypothetical protein FACS1894190_04960 [Spirochaetia bacterium]|nr:hypothetical protein FACS1894190_04960 [Spirochaetia bacterium]GHV23326.1 hypothetical protein FACS189494_11240 [Spirochaetia bacterium]